jgi:hypothetical protein
VAHRKRAREPDVAGGAADVHRDVAAWRHLPVQERVPIGQRPWAHVDRHALAGAGRQVDLGEAGQLLRGGLDARREFPEVHLGHLGAGVVPGFRDREMYPGRLRRPVWREAEGFDLQPS